MDRDIVVGTVICYGLDSSGFEPWCEWNFRHPYIPALGPIQRPVQGVPGGKAAGAWHWPPTCI